MKLIFNISTVIQGFLLVKLYLYMFNKYNIIEIKIYERVIRFGFSFIVPHQFIF